MRNDHYKEGSDDEIEFFLKIVTKTDHFLYLGITYNIDFVLIREVDQE